ncbi:5'-nucleotidase C-terminal domain-containing protein [Nocardia sp. NPDC049220]|uniref:5'-nucleotidase C-terminal domain-containing protein n=1 Tax=Nocardia sp. NPDC049220 TaxID=3155273 RepID=UPI0033F8A851
MVSTNDVPASHPDEVHLFGFNDLHGNLQPSAESTGKIAGYDAGGAAYLATHLARLKAAYPASAVVAAGDNIGASPVFSALFHDEPTITFLNNVGVAASSVGNHEFDDGITELARVRQVGCAADGCSPGVPFTGAKFQYLAANVMDAQGTYTYSQTTPVDSKVIPDSLRIAGQALDPVARYRITTNNFLASGGDGFTVFNEGTDITVGPIDLDAFKAFLRDKPALHAPSSRVEQR